MNVKIMRECEKNGKNCPPRYKNIGTENFGDEKKVTAELLYQFCKNDSYLYEQILKLWDKTDPETRKRFYPPYYMDTSKSYGIAPLLFEGTDITDEDLTRKISNEDLLKLKKQNGTIQNAYQLSNALYEKYIVDFDSSNDQTYWAMNSNSTYDTLVIENENIIEDTSTLQVVTEDYGTVEHPDIRHTVLPMATTEIITNTVPYTVTEYTPVKVTVIKKYTPAQQKKLQNKINKEYKKKNQNKAQKTKVDTYGKLTLDAHCSGPYKNWNNNSVWYIGYNRHKNYNVKSAWKKDPYNEDKTNTKKYGRIPSICRAQTFKAEHTGELRKVTFKMKGSKSSVSPCTVEIRTVDKKGKPTQEILARTEQKFNHNTASMVNFTFKKPCKVTKGTTYAIVLRSPLSNFNHCYWIAGWASTCFSNSRKRAYYDGETFLSEDNGKTWIVHGTKEKCYGSHYYDWGFAEAPVNFGFEVYIAPNTGTKTVKTAGKLKIPKAPVSYKGTEVVKKPKASVAYYDSSIILNYYKAGEYYLEFKPFVGNFYTSIQCIYDIQEQDTTRIGEYTWEIFNTDTKEWQSFEDFAETDFCSGQNISPYRDAESNKALSSHELSFYKALTYIKIRLKLTLTHNVLTFDEASGFRTKLNAEFDNIKALNDTNADDNQISVVGEEDFSNWYNSIFQHFAWLDGSEDEVPLDIRKLKSVSFKLSKKPSFSGYLRTLEYHPIQEGMLPACIWAEVDVDAIPKNNGQVKVDIVHEQTAIDHILFYKPNNMELRPYIVEYEEEVLGKSVNNAEYSNSSLVQEYVLKNSTSNEYALKDLKPNKEFIEWLKGQDTPVYILPFETKIPVKDEENNIIYELDSTTGETVYETIDGEQVPKVADYENIFFYDDWDGENVRFPIAHYPAYPINSCSIGTDNITISLDDLIKETSSSVKYVHDKPLEGDIKQVKLVFTYETEENESSDETGTEGEQETGEIILQPLNFNDDGTINETLAGDYQIKDNTLILDITPPVDESAGYLHQMSQFISLDGALVNVNPTYETATLEDAQNETPVNYVSNMEIVIEMNGYDYNEFQDYIVDYDNKTFNFYNPWALSEGDLKINYNPLWCRNLNVEDFPLRMDLWTEYFRIREVYRTNEDDTTGEMNEETYYVYDKCLINDCGEIIVNTETQADSDEQLHLSVPPLDNIRLVELQDLDGNSMTDDPLVEDEDYLVDYLENTINMIYPRIEDGQIIMVKYTPNLTDTGLSLAYRLSRPLYDINGSEITNPNDKLLVDITSHVEHGIEDGDNVFVMSNYFTTRT